MERLDRKRIVVKVGGEKKWATGNLTYWTEYNSGNWYFTSVFCENVMKVNKTIWSKQKITESSGCARRRCGDDAGVMSVVRQPRAILMTVSRTPRHLTVPGAHAYSCAVINHGGRAPGRGGAFGSAPVAPTDGLLPVETANCSWKRNVA
ncbi:hypothetical protein EVAR_88672_1 [Eumeta japonica]|uniref:Uncharacterized protein n=1 Tax=Eumeta variegata TaxID=151549 RepID=A0A4C1YBC3_EUMVA|nr:hypothetical protein EVAR_88672_1 [Eumeta japonica]